MSHMSGTTEDMPIEAPAIIEGVAENGQMLDVVFSFYSGPAGVRDKGNGRVEFAYFRAPPLSRWRAPAGEGTIGGLRYRVVRGQISDITPMMATITADEVL
jgi:hypothetical protein